MTNVLLSMSGVSKSFGATQALNEVSFEVRGGQVRALIGENGAGKSTLMKILSGVHRPDAGRLAVDGKPYAPVRPADAIAAGVAMIYQELNLAPHLSVEANILLGQERSRFGWVRAGDHRRIVREALARLSQPDLPLDMPVGRLPIAKQQLVEIARALASDARILVFDEPTSSLTEEDTEHLFAVIRDLRAAGLGIVYISHFLEEVTRIGDLFTVLRDGRSVAEGSLAEVTTTDLARWMVGREIDELFPKSPHTPGGPLLEIRGLSGRTSPQDVNLVLRRGEIFGLAGLVGAGRSELVRAVFGLNEVRSGEVRVVGVGPVGRSPRASIRRGLGLVSEDRKEEGLALPMSIADNLTLTNSRPYRRFGFLNLRRRDAAVRQWMNRIECKAVGPDQPIGQLSGGNQQKIAIARLLHQQADLLLLDEPTRGIDIGTKAQIYRLIGELAAQGKGIILVSSYLPELMNVCDRIGVMCRGRLREVRAARDWTEEQVMHCATGTAAAQADSSATPRSTAAGGPGARATETGG
jgi:ribose transport system ATP-binding protein